MAGVTLHTALFVMVNARMGLLTGWTALVPWVAPIGIGLVAKSRLTRPEEPSVPPADTGGRSGESSPRPRRGR